MGCDAATAIERLSEGNSRYVSENRPGDFGPVRRTHTATEGQEPYAAIITCSDSRVVPEAIFSAGLGDLFVVRTAGNTIGAEALGSIDYCISHLGCRLVVVMGHSRCGAIGAALEGHGEGLLTPVIGKIRSAIGNEKDPGTACKLNVLVGVRELREAFQDRDGLEIVGTMYDISSGKVEFL